MTIGFGDTGFRTNKHNKKEAFLQLVNCCYTQMFQANIFLQSKKGKRKIGQLLEFYGNLFKKKKKKPQGSFFHHQNWQGHGELRET